MTALLMALFLAADGATVHVVSNPAGATVRLDATELGVTPLDAQLPAGKHTLTVSLREYPPLKRALKKPRDGETLTFDFIAAKRQQLEAAVAKAQQAYDSAEARLVKAQEAGGGVEGAETKMSDAVRALETAERELEDFKQAHRGVKAK